MLEGEDEGVEVEDTDTMSLIDKQRSASVLRPNRETEIERDRPFSGTTGDEVPSCLLSIYIYIVVGYSVECGV